jgi:hypothetical protein
MKCGKTIIWSVSKDLKGGGTLVFAGETNESTKNLSGWPEVGQKFKSLASQIRV